MSLLQVYKPGQGRAVRWGTAGAILLITALGMYWLSNETPLQNVRGWVKGVSVVAWALAGCWLAFWVINRPRSAEFMILTESEMRKVSWPTRASVTGSTKVVIFLTLLFAILLFMVDIGFNAMFHLFGLY